MKRTKLIMALAVSVAILILLQMLLTPKYMEHSQEGALIGEYYENAGEKFSYTSQSPMKITSFPPAFS